MANRLTMAEIDAILTLHTTRHSNREIAALLGKDRGTVGKYVARAKSQNRPNAPPGPEGPPTTGPPSDCEPFRDQILAKVEQGFEAKRISQDLAEEHGESAPSYYSVRRFVGRLKRKTPLPFRRMETEPAEEAQVDFGSGAPVRSADGKTRRPWIFRIVLSYSRKAYSEAVWHQSSESFIQCLENAFRYFGGSVKRLVIDNLKAAVARADWYDPEVHPKLQSFARHYGTVVLPTRPYTPRHKGKVESSVKYVKRNALKGRVFASLAEENQFLLRWETRVADQRIHGTTKQQVERLFEEGERRQLLPLPAERFPFFHEAHRAVHRDGHLEVERAFYSAPPEYVGRRLWVRWGRQAGPRVQRPLGTGGRPRQGRAGPVPHGGRAYPARKGLRRGTGHRRPAAAGGINRSLNATVGRSDDPGSGGRGRTGPGGPEAPGRQAPQRGPGRGLPGGVGARGLPLANHSSTAPAPRRRTTAVRLPRIPSDHPPPERLLARLFTPVPKGATPR